MYPQPLPFHITHPCSTTLCTSIYPPKPHPQAFRVHWGLFYVRAPLGGAGCLLVSCPSFSGSEELGCWGRCKGGFPPCLPLLASLAFKARTLESLGPGLSLLFWLGVDNTLTHRGTWAKPGAEMTR